MIYELIGKKIKILYNTEDLAVTIFQHDITWEAAKEFRPYLQCDKRKIYFSEAKFIKCEKNYVGNVLQLRTHFSKFYVENELTMLEFATCIWIDDTSDSLVCEWIPINDGNCNIENVYWPEEFEFSDMNEKYYTVLPIQQGILIPNTWKVELSDLGGYLGFMGTTGAYMSWVGQMKDRTGYIAVCETPWDATYYANHSEKGEGTQLGIRWENSLGEMRYRRILRYYFIANGDYNDMCKIYRKYMIDKGKFLTLDEKIRKLPNIKQLIGSMVVHKCVNMNISPECRFYDSENKRNHKMITFMELTNEIMGYHESGVQKIYLHIDGWTNEGYDNGHPEANQVCEEAGGEKGLQHLITKLHRKGDLVAIHDQYRDYYFSAKGFNINNARQNKDGGYTEHAIWAGGKQTYLCPIFAPYYLKRNMKILSDNNISVDGMYIDVFTCNPADECYNPNHPVTRRESFEFRQECLEYLFRHGIIPSSEEVSDWALDSIVTAHYAPYEFMFEAPGKPRKGIPVPLFELVYHECVIIPWFMEKTSDDDYMLYALLNGGIPYLVRESPYLGMDGSFDEEIEIGEKEHISRCKTVAELNEKVAFCEMISHKFLEGNRQKTVFSNGVEVVADFNNLTYEIKEPI